LTAGVRLPIALAIIVAGIAISVAASVVALPGAAVGLGLGGTTEAGVAGFVVVATVGSWLFAPVIPAMLVRAYQLRSAPAPEAPSPAMAA
jgi:hypothetical protein